MYSNKRGQKSNIVMKNDALWLFGRQSFFKCVWELEMVVSDWQHLFSTIARQLQCMVVGESEQGV